MAHPPVLERCCYSDVQSLEYEVAVLPIGATEPHGKHLPYGQDFLSVKAIAEEACRRANDGGARTIALPTIPYGVDTNQLGFPFAMSLYQKTLNVIVDDLIESLVCHGVPKLVILNGHGGNEFKSYLREQCRNPRMFVCSINWWTVAEDAYKDIFTHRDDHSGEMETSVALHLMPELVHLERAGDGSTRETDFEGMNSGWVQIARPWHLFTKDSASGDPHLATAEKGVRYAEICISRIAGFLSQLSATPRDDRFPYSRAFATEGR
ncbi:MAG TPA: creatininase family protein [Candidatus Latescibacteria bacterium]|jgi:creatinine amidohydrolase|nr:creatininase family protein [Candidatus Latescibacterota bacterium]HPC44979.1 creatininase family protein [Candidatus Latescibacterota bacterium]HQI75890.1 creatininase family protein [Candidatus Latescibacterota bacterium]HQK22918.1 creatininase family protein [Candidatus Latescibacterota bacterium]HRS93639.1 creatininase family protein [Candidatus Latescibacterota bacterium]